LKEKRKAEEEQRVEERRKAEEVEQRVFGMFAGVV